MHSVTLWDSKHLSLTWHVMDNKKKDCEDLGAVRTCL